MSELPEAGDDEVGATSSWGSSLWKAFVSVVCDEDDEHDVVAGDLEILISRLVPVRGRLSMVMPTRRRFGTILWRSAVNFWIVAGQFFELRRAISARWFSAWRSSAVEPSQSALSSTSADRGAKMI